MEACQPGTAIWTQPRWTCVDLSLLELVAAFGALTFGSVVRGTLGFGDALVAIPLLTLVVSPQTAVPVIAVLSAALGLGIGLTNREQVDWSGAGVLLLGAGAGLPLGIWALSAWSADRLETVLGGALLLVSVQGLLRPRTQNWATLRTGPLFGFAGGVLGGMLGMAGPAFVLWTVGTGWPPDRIRATLQGVFLPLAVMAMVGHAIAGLWSHQVWVLAALGIPAAALGTVVGNRLAQRLTASRFQAVLWTVLLGLGGVLLWR